MPIPTTPRGLLATLGALWLFTVAAFPAPALPDEVRRFLDRREQCQHWAGEEPYDTDRAQDIAAAMRDLDCDRIEADEAVLRHRYARRREIIRALGVQASDS